MSIDQIAAKATIEFPRPIDRKETEALLTYIAENMPQEVHPYEKYPSKIRRLPFHLVPVAHDRLDTGWELEDYEDNISLWDNVREIVNQYFEQE